MFKKKEKKKIIIAIFISVALVIGVSFLQFIKVKNPNSIESLEKQEIYSLTAESEFLIQDFIKKLPEEYYVRKGYFSEAIGALDQESFEIFPCNPDGKDPIKEPYCNTKIILTELSPTKTLQEFINSNQILSWYSEGIGTDLVFSEIFGNQGVLTPEFFMCEGTGGGTCFRKWFLIRLGENTNFLAEISYWPTRDSEIQNKINEVINLYESILLENK